MATPAAAKKPQDRKPKAPEKVEITLGEGDDKRVVPGHRVTVEGITLEVPDEAMDDFEILDDFRTARAEEDPTAFPSILRRLVGETEYRRVIAELRDPATGRVTISRGIDFVNGIFGALNPNS
ncbi:hypothetical protein [Microbacterium halotolerans]|uniref:hypothetical protein n=1 Tax=Microbacterium halotolerans TaxID=246613 RepID=UPI000E6AD53A|nr:hypothetical protein [Microbacterium halotolerans]